MESTPNPVSLAFNPKLNLMMERPLPVHWLPRFLRSRAPSISHAVPLGEETKLLVTFEAGEKSNPHNFHPVYKIWLTTQMSLLALAGALGSSILSSASSEIAEYATVSSEVTSLTVALFVLGMPPLTVSTHFSSLLNYEHLPMSDLRCRTQ